MATIFIAEYFEKAKEESYCNASARLDGLRLAIQHHPDLGPVISAFEQLSRGDYAMNQSFMGAERFGMAEAAWLSRFNDRLTEISLKQAIVEMGDLAMLLNGGLKFKGLAEAFQDILLGYRRIQALLNRVG